MKTLISMTAFVKEQYELFIQDKITCEQFRERVWKFANFLSLTPEIWMFVPCKFVDGVWVVLEEPTWEYVKSLPLTSEGVDAKYWRLKKEFDTAKERCYFEGFEVRCPNAISNGNISITFTISGGILLDKVCDDYFENIGTITKLEHLTDYNLPLTATAQKEIGL